MADAFIVAAARTAGGRRKGKLAGVHPADLAARVLDAVVERAGIAPGEVEDVVMGCVGQIGEQSFNVARQAVLTSVLPQSTPATTVDRQCGSSQQALHFAAATVMAGQMDVVIAAGVREHDPRADDDQLFGRGEGGHGRPLFERAQATLSGRGLQPVR